MGPSADFGVRETCVRGKEIEKESNRKFLKMPVRLSLLAQKPAFAARTPTKDPHENKKRKKNARPHSLELHPSLTPPPR